MTLAIRGRVSALLDTSVVTADAEALRLEPGQQLRSR